MRCLAPAAAVERVVVALLILWAAVLAGADLARRRVPNLGVLVVLIPASAVLLLSSEGLLGVSPLPSVLGCALALALLLPAYFCGWLGAGDVKVAAVMGLLLGPVATAAVLVLSALALGGIALASIISGRVRRAPAMPALAAGFAAVLGLAAAG
jgi:prepilin peptidase CpaA